MTEQSFQDYMGQRPDIADQIDGLMVHRPAAPHPRVDFHVNGQRPGGAGQLLLQRPDKPRVGNGRREMVFDHVGNFRARGRPQNDDGRLDAAHAQLNALIGVGDAQHPRAFAQCRVRNFNGAVSVGVGLDRLHEIYAGTDQPLNFPQIGGKIIQIHFDPAAIFLFFS